jgi:hypothetical protein
MVRKQKAPDNRPSGYNKAGYTRYYCADRVLGITKCPSCADSLVEGALLAQVLMQAGGYLSQSDEIAKELAAEVHRCKAEYEKHDIEIENLADGVAKTGAMPKLVALLKAAEGKQALAKRQLDEAEAKLNALVIATDGNEDFKAIAETMKSPDPAARAALREKIIRLISFIWIWPDEQLAGIEWKGMGNVVTGAILGEATSDVLKRFKDLRRPIRPSGRKKRKSASA